MLGPLLFLIYINDLPEDLETASKLFADDISFFATILDIKKSSNDLNNDLATVEKWAFQWKMAFNPDPNKQATVKLFFPIKKYQLHILFCILIILLLHLHLRRNILG